MKNLVKKHLLPAIILFKPQIGENIGSVARAMKNCGLNDLRIIDPRDGWPNSKAFPTAVGAIDIIKNAKIYDTLNDSLNDISFLVSTSARKRFMNKKIENPDSISSILVSNTFKKVKSAIIFGPESSGLTNDEISVSDIVVTVPLDQNFSSLNLSQAVLIMTWEFHKKFINSFNIYNSTNSSKKNTLINISSNIKDRELFYLRLEKLLDNNKFFPTKQMKPKIMRNIKNVFIRAKLTKQELSTFHGIISSLDNN